MIPLSLGWRPMTSKIVRKRSRFLYALRTSRLRLGLSKLLMNIRGFLKRNCSTMSAFVILSAVAVNAILGTFGKYSSRTPNWVYSGRKSCPHCETQCASSMAIMDIFTNCCSHCISVISLSGEMYRIFISPFWQRERMILLTYSSLLLLRASAAIPLACKASTWSFIKEIKGDTTSAVPSSNREGIW